MAKIVKKPTKPAAPSAKKAAPAGARVFGLRTQEFIRLYPLLLNATEAAKQAGFSVKTAYSQGQRLLKDVDVAAAIQFQMDKHAKKCDITAENILESIVEVRERCMQRVPVMRRVEGELVQKIEDGQGVWEFDSRGALKANELLGKHLKLFTDRVEIEGNVSITVVTGVPDGDDE